MKKVLITSFFFPPCHTIGSVRLGGLAKYLPQFGWEPIILTPQLPGPCPLDIKVIETAYSGDVTFQIKKLLRMDVHKRLEENLGLPLKVRETNNLNLINLLGFFYGMIIFPEEQRTWLPDGVKTGIQFLKKTKVDCILSSGPPFTAHRIAHKLKNYSHTPWIADLRDLWSQNHYYLFGPFFRFIDERIELKTLSNADHLIVVSKPYVAELRKLHKNSRVDFITNGFDPDIVIDHRLPLSRDFTILYSGHIYPGKRDPSLLFKAIRKLIDKNILAPDIIKVKFYGQKQHSVSEQIAKYRLENIVQQLGNVPREIALQEQRTSQVLLLLNWNHPSEVGIFPGKVFEYLAAKRPILALGGPKDGVVSELMRSTQAGVHVTTESEIERFLLKAYEEFKTIGSVQYTGNVVEIYKYTHLEMVKKFAVVLNSVAEKK